jgi:hypothetical protein
MLKIDSITSHLPVIRPQSRIRPCRISGKHFATLETKLHLAR